MNLKTFFTLSVILLCTQSYGQRLSVQDYIQKYKNDAVKDMLKTGVPASITMAQALLESENGNSPLAREANNHFGIKCHKEWTGPVYLHDDDLKQECFRKYGSALESYDDHSSFLRTRDRYAGLFLLDRKDYKGWAYGLKKAGYATNPKYPQMIIKLIEDNRLFELDNADSDEASDKTLVASAAPKEPARKQPPLIQAPEKRNLSTGESTPEASPMQRIQSINDVKFIVARQEDSYLKIAGEFELGLWQIYKYNEIDKSTPLRPGQRIYLQPKRRKAPVKEHTVKAGETLHDIAQLYGIKAKHIRRLNELVKNDSDLKPGLTLILQ